MSLTVITPPDIDAFIAHFLQSAKSYTRLTVSSQDETFTRCLRTAYRQAERLTRRALSEQTLKLHLPYFCNEISLPRPPLLEVTDFEYIDVAGSLMSVDSSVYLVDDAKSPGRIVLAENQSWPTPSQRPNAVTITYRAGYENLDNIPEDLIHGIFMLATYFYDNRGDVSTVSKSPLPFASSNIFRQHRVNII